MKRIVLAFLIFVVLFATIIAYVQLGPVRTVLGIQQSFRSGDMESLNDSIDFEAVRESMKLQMQNHVNQKNVIESENPLLQTLYSNFSSNFIDSMVDEYLKPEAIQSLFDFSGDMIEEAKSNGYLDGSSADQSEGEHWLTVLRQYLALCDFKYISQSEFEVSLKETITEPVSLVLFAGTRIRFQRDGINWMVNDIVFPESFFASKF